MNEDQQYVSFDRLVSQKLSEQLADANRQIATLAAMCDIKDAQIKQLQTALAEKNTEPEEENQ
nr:ABC transporter permease [Bifidobacterium catenulatum]